MAKRGPKRRTAPKSTAAKPATPMLDIGLPTDKDAAIEHAMAAQKAEDWPEATTRWEGVRKLFPDEVAGYENGIHCLGAAGRGAEREALFGEAADRFPGLVRFNDEFAWLAHHRKDWPTAIARWKTVLQRFPGHRSGFLGAAFTCSAAGMHAEADAVLAGAIEQDPQNREYAIAYARQAQFRGEPDLAFRRWESIRERTPNDPTIYSNAAICLNNLGRGAEAIALLQMATASIPGFGQHPQGLSVYLGYCSTPEPKIALERLRKLYAAFPEDARVALCLAVAYRNGLDWADAIQVLDSAVAIHEDDARLTREMIHIHGLKGDLDAVAAWGRIAIERFPGDVTFEDQISQIRFQARYRQPSNDGHQNVIPTGPTRVDSSALSTDNRDLFMSFISMGSDCVFGFVQRTYGAEPLDLLRWANMPFGKLLEALDERFEYIGIPANIHIKVQHEVFGFLGAREYTAVDGGYEIWSHTFAPVSPEADIEKIRTEVSRRNRFLARELVDELESGERVLVYIDAENKLDGADRKTLLASVRRYGRSPLLYVGRAELGAPAAPLQRKGDLLFLASLPSEYISETRVRDYAPWVDLCRKVLAAIRQPPTSP